ncbi:MAG: hypothetical protein KGL11_14715 [Alphaproteobacteria bacterium]|nr:hypothetical protein [Alphaproteobacteria bacterium]
MTLTRADLDAMPATLRRQLSRYLETVSRSRGEQVTAVQNSAADAAMPLDRRQVAALVRDISFHRLGRPLRALLDRLAATESPLARSRLATVLPAPARAWAGRYVAVLNRLAAKTAKRPALPFCRFIRSNSTYVIHSTTRKWLRDILPAIERAGDHEEPLWE